MRVTLPALGLMVAVILLHGAVVAADISVPAAVQSKIDSVLAEASDLSTPGKNPESFLAALGALRRVLDPRLVEAATRFESEGINAKMIVLVSGLAQDPSRLDEIQKYYITEGLKNARIAEGRRAEPGSPSPVVDFTPPLRLDHVSQEYRLAWEFFMIMRWIPNALEGFPDRVVARALVAIGDPRSVPVIEFRYKTSASDARCDPSEFNNLLLQFPSDTALRALLACVEEWDKQASVRRSNAEALIPGLAYSGQNDPTVQIRQMQREAPTKIEAWRHIIEFDLSANPAQLEILRKIRTAVRGE